MISKISHTHTQTNTKWSHSYSVLPRRDWNGVDHGDLWGVPHREDTAVPPALCDVPAPCGPRWGRRQSALHRHGGHFPPRAHHADRGALRTQPVRGAGQHRVRTRVQHRPSNAVARGSIRDDGRVALCPSRRGQCDGTLPHWLLRKRRIECTPNAHGTVFKISSTVFLLSSLSKKQTCFLS